MTDGSPPARLAPNERLAAATAARDWPGVREALQAGAEADLPVFDGGTVLHLAIYEGLVEVAQEMLKRGASAQTVDEFGRTPLHWVAEMGGAAGEVASANNGTGGGGAGWNDLIVALSRAGAVVNAIDGRGRTPLHAAAIRGHAPTVEGLLQAGAAVNARKSDGLTPLHFALVRNHAAVAAVLLAHGADPDLAAANGETPAALARRLGRQTGRPGNEP